ncbi:MAG: response regulator, partial [Pseudomonadota bacterium]|nr:response regulator [Pseudomonadota bacterium]
LAALIEAPLQMRSEVGRGTVFTLELPPGVAARDLPAAAAPAKAPPSLTLDGTLIVVVEDEPAVREGLEVLLTGWGASVTTLDSVAAAQVWAEAAPPGLRPAMVIADYRLEHGATGVEAIVALRRRFGAGLPALIVTGSTMTGHEREAIEHDFHLLVKPVLPNKLRAMVAFKLRGAQLAEISSASTPA